MYFAWMMLGLLLACKDKDPSGDSPAADDSDSKVSPDDSDGCPDGAGVVEGTLVGSDNLPLGSGKATLFDETGSEELVSDVVNDDGLFHVVYGAGDYLLRGEYSSCVGEDTPVTLCGDQTVYQNLQLTCAP